jgi:hypothetical protein
VAVVQPLFVHLFVCPSFVVCPSSFVYLSVIVHHMISTSWQWLQVLGAEAGGRCDVGCSFIVVVGCCLGCGSGGMVVGGVGHWVVALVGMVVGGQWAVVALVVVDGIGWWLLVALVAGCWWRWLLVVVQFVGSCSCQ